ncbi:phosphotransferase family protein [Streptomyces sp. MUM 178J]|uniref:phosphotransferase family protein n=1 Tax=Streptomyces sp. MUM 178J TaxID=2791991 RepID=UPI001F04F09E|nr:aminoglycoside phosphotransferase family protein [Streptomyces sp. MUM 178J]WRQ78534.1 aminoglycoside phosphotransferase family protein [Streptomyces sp. MUM 178J]
MTASAAPGASAPAASASVVPLLAGVAQSVAHAPDRARSRRQPCHACRQAAHVLAERDDGTVVRHDTVVAKAHAPDTDPDAHRTRLAVAAHPRLAGVLLPPLPATGPLLHGRPVSAWPYGLPVDPGDPDAAPWEQAAALLARLHRIAAADLPGLPGPLPAMRGPAKAALAVARMEGAAAAHPAADAVRRAWLRLPAWARGEAPPPLGGSLCHGDLHLGQLVRHPVPQGRWLLIDVDDLGLGDPAWDLARPAAWYAAGLLPPYVWRRFLGAYRSAQGPAVPAGASADPWPRLDVPARALTVQTAALALAKAAAEHREPDEVEQLVLDACVRIAALPPELACDPAP